jgi:hypothetical protein
VNVALGGRERREEELLGRADGERAQTASLGPMRFPGARDEGAERSPEELAPRAPMGLSRWIFTDGGLAAGLTFSGIASAS